MKRLLPFLLWLMGLSLCVYFCSWKKEEWYLFYLPWMKNQKTVLYTARWVWCVLYVYSCVCKIEDFGKGEIMKNLKIWNISTQKYLLSLQDTKELHSRQCASIPVPVLHSTLFCEVWSCFWWDCFFSNIPFMEVLMAKYGFKYQCLYVEVHFKKN